MINNAVRYLGLGLGQTTRRRLDAYYVSNGLSNKLGFAEGVGIEPGLSPAIVSAARFVGAALGLLP